MLRPSRIASMSYAHVGCPLETRGTQDCRAEQRFVAVVACCGLTAMGTLPFPPVPLRAAAAPQCPVDEEDDDSGREFALRAPHVDEAGDGRCRFLSPSPHDRGCEDGCRREATMPLPSAPPLVPLKLMLHSLLLLLLLPTYDLPLFVLASAPFPPPPPPPFPPPRCLN